MDTAGKLSNFLGIVEQQLGAVLVDGDAGPGVMGDTLMEAARHLCLGSGSKRARPMLVSLFGDAVGLSSEHLVDVAVSAELIHSASLLHDDVVDAGMFRRGRPTVNARWGNIVAVMSGDLILSTTLLRLAQLDERLSRSALSVVSEMTRAAITEVEARGVMELPLPRLRYIAEGKTGSLFGWCGHAAATLANQPEAAKRFDGFGRHLGVAFQIADDIRDVLGTDVGKPQYADLQSRTPSMPILLAVEKDEGLRRKLKDAWAFSSITPDRIKEIGASIIACGAVEQSLAQMNVEIDAALGYLGSFANSDGGAELASWARKLSSGITDQVRSKVA
ncbi:polyprenyl synthetase family protein [Stigmatella aurantiaca]|uniref:Heptaprenyl diphosphate synthasecomponent II n=1 Tax=Stigmatella aurantiaca (strain DW4/3-1) TaxID=378806 RepID=Q08TS3_STIAD|nr:polyprenyl synthetase family protein [Stigmatella aurantiaca]ADO71946.1 Polyprenyl synthase family protein [Stigmatella aurantiaca DW4/3-1]EAU63870.1 heptaprenyl diphosphate synthasecomponent II [Stigmatella aurantiaca DW4/3-1]